METMNKTYKAIMKKKQCSVYQYIGGVIWILLSLSACDLERIELGSGNVKKFNTSVGGNSNDFPLDVLPNADGTYIVAGRTQSFTADKNNQMYILKVVANGLLVDQNNFGYDGDDWAVAVVPVADGGYVLAGRTTNSLTFDVNIFLVKVNSSLDEVWRNTFGAEDSTELAFGIMTTGTSDFLVGYTQTYSSGGDVMPLKFLRVNANGAKVSTKTGTTGSLTITHMIKTLDGSIVLSGYDYSTGSTLAYIAKFMGDGSYIWSRTYPSVNTNFNPAYGVVEMSDKSLVLAGSDLGGVDHDFLTVQYSEIGMEQSDYIWGGANADELMAITKSTDGEVVVMGYTNSFTSSLEVYVSKRKRSDGSEIWAQHFGNSWTQGGDIELCPDGGFILCTGQNQADADIVLVKMDANGEYQ
jgi:hypothetical protein